MIDTSKISLIESVAHNQEYIEKLIDISIRSIIGGYASIPPIDELIVFFKTDSDSINSNKSIDLTTYNQVLKINKDFYDFLISKINQNLPELTTYIDPMNRASSDIYKGIEWQLEQATSTRFEKHTAEPKARIHLHTETPGNQHNVECFDCDLETLVHVGEELEKAFRSLKQPEYLHSLKKLTRN
ncbi:hypothetical protein HZS_6578 [Henneguya salminicola]|nr:hypothetical protein HZS_6578 [Henneguya salminicola]